MSKKLRFYYYKPGSCYDIYCPENITYICAVDIPCITAAVLELVMYGINKKEIEMFREILE